MNSHKNFAVGILQENEAWELFKNITGDIVESSELQSTATEVVRECAGLPIAIVSVAGALKNKSLPLWKNALRELTRPSSRNFTGMQAVVYSTIELSYNHLESEELKSTFLLCAAMGSPMIIDLLKYGIGLGLFQHTDTVEEAQDRVHTLLSNLEASGLLLEASNSKEFAIHDVVRDVAVSVAARDWHMFAVLRNVVRPKDWPNADCTGISLFYNDIREFPEELECPRLKFFYIGNKDPSLSIPDNFFAETKELRVLDLTEVNLSSIPPSIHQLANLRTLCLDHCVLGDINIIGKLKKLEILSLVESNVEQLPMDLGQLTRLQLLDLSNCSKLRLIPAGIMSNLSRLEQLYMGNSFNRWDTEDLDNQASNISLSELRHLPQLTVLEIHIPDAQVTLKDLFSEELDRFTYL
ncbi:probable disease resistance protein At4g27220 [Carica papaya]|uniref:probable disease resistance protein At4g27220 n=1 Tax=Carica papaya TaxID=3649 RepID=UPI000B8C8EAB|nr:probable disease resistance protein At4g27220 [Carica papaya]